MDETARLTEHERQSEEFRHTCEVNWLVRKIDHAKDKKLAADEYIALVRKHRGNAAADKLLADTRKAWTEKNGRKIE
jgi:hypothetical protein